MVSHQVRAQQPGRERDEHHGQQQEAVGIDEGCRRFTDQFERSVMIDPGDEDHGEAQHERKADRGQMQKRRFESCVVPPST